MSLDIDAIVRKRIAELRVEKTWHQQQQAQHTGLGPPAQPDLPARKTREAPLGTTSLPIDRLNRAIRRDVQDYHRVQKELASSKRALATVEAEHAAIELRVEELRNALAAATAAPPA